MNFFLNKKKGAKTRMSSSPSIVARLLAPFKGDRKPKVPKSPKKEKEVKEVAAKEEP